ncbi:MAG: DUF2203 domain-containing protein [Proteobacteria bacterium]|nr:DUF2203 domain-containing protein [Pseudomonadota bacterium]
MSQQPVSRYFTVAEANSHIAELQELFGRVMQLRSQLKVLYQELDEAGFAPRDNSEHELSEMPPPIARLHSVFLGLADTLQEQIEAIMEIGCVIKDIETGLVDWPSRHEGRDIWLCWKYGELEVEFWHELTTGFAGRRPVSDLGTEHS